MHIILEKRKKWLIIAGASVCVAALIAGGVWYYFAKVYVPLVPINPSDTIASWHFTYTNDADLEKQATNDLTHLTGLLGKGQYTDYDLYVGIAQDEEHLGDGRAAYQALSRAIAIDANTGLAWHNLGELMARLGALQTAKAAYEKAVTVQPDLSEYHYALIQFLTAHFPNDDADILSAMRDALANGEDANIYTMKASWLTAIGSTTAAIAAWEKARSLTAPSARSAIDAAIARLQSQQ